MTGSREELPPLVVRLLARCTFPEPGTPVACAVSGGADSLALLALAAAAGTRVTAFHVDHGLRPGSAAEARVVARAAERFGAAFEARSVHVEPGPNLEERARDARRAVLPADVLTGHTLDDQAETVLLFLLRGTGPAGLTGIAPARRPLLGLRRHETRAICDALGLEVVVDPSNDDRRFVRNRVRHELLPLMDDIAGREVAPLVARTAALQRQLVEAVELIAAHVDATDARSVSAAPPAVGAAVVRRWWRAETGVGHPPDAAAVARVLDVAAGRAVAADLTGGWRVERRSQRLRLVPPLGEPRRDR